MTDAAGPLDDALDTVEALPADVRLVHIGPHKTGTTAVQNALWNARPALAAQAVRHVGQSRNPAGPVQAVTARPSPYSDNKPPPMRRWNGLVREIRGVRTGRVVVSSEFFAWATDDVAKRVVEEVGRDRIHVVVTVRPLARVLPSTWQQNVQQGWVVPFDDWVRDILADPGRPFWHLERHDQLVDRWAAAAGLDRVTVVVVDDRDHGFVMRAFERLLGLAPGTLGAERDESNRSLSLAEAEAVRAFNIAYAAQSLPRSLHARVMRFGAAQLLKERVPPKDEPRVRLPGWAFEQLLPIQREVVDRIRASRVRVVGDLDLLLADTPPTVDPPTRLEMIPPDVVGALGISLLESTGAVRSAAASRGPFQVGEPAVVARVPTYQLFGALAGRIWRATVGRIPLPRRGSRADAGDARAADEPVGD